MIIAIDACFFVVLDIPTIVKALEYTASLGRKLMTLYILGNGFDLAHGLPTKYWDFRMYLNAVHPEFLEAFEEAN